jgi:hypothetical protein
VTPAVTGLARQNQHPHAPVHASLVGGNLSTLGGPPAAELGIDLGGILRRTRGVLIGRLRGPDMEELDVGGPLLFSAILGASHLVVSLPAVPGKQ